MGLRAVDGVLLDVDDTLVDTRGAFEHALAQVARAYLPDLPDTRLGEVLAAWRADVSGHYRRYTRGEIGYVEQRRERANELHEAFGGPVLDEAAFRAWDEVFEQGFAAGWTAHPDASGAIDALTGAGLAVGALTNAAVGYQTQKMTATGLGHVPVLVGMDTLGVGKPAPQVFLEGCRRLGTDPGRTVYVGDELDIDALAAVQAGLVGVWLDRPGGRRHVIGDEEIEGAVQAGVRVIGSLGQLVGLVRTV
ncbi:HAD family hydrolase [Isoptericola sp. b441]|uniref:HAD family hydrolase n=2 Tax=Actinotalea lenta TaxID=3064654 RepID=A0ABT9DEX9_9CELL|nr:MULTISPECIES: HAD family hydrolase [unclassified Isoptericola]MDO8108193.1 HAD family hydrolase [Isoptericola sp. b441]MDO8120136.1 HAD family hydrolase [Isoptericola sp. b490]